MIATNILDCGRNRAEQFGLQVLGRTPEEAAWSERYAKALSDGMGPVEVGERVLEGIRRNEPYIFTHPEWKTFVERRNRKIEAALGTPDPAKEESLLRAFRWIARG